MVDADAALSIVLESAPSTGTEKVQLMDTLGRTCARNILADVDLPSFDNSAMDGYALLSSDVKAALQNTPVTLAVIGESSAGNPFNGAVGPGESVRIMTGAMVPRGADSVVPLESVRRLSEDKIECVAANPVKMHIRARGEDIKEGEIVLRDGEVIRPPHLGILAALGVKKARVGRKPLVNILSTGDELVEIDETPGEGQIRNSSAFALAGYITLAGGTARFLGIVPDRNRLIRRKIEEALDADIALVTGGVSVGKYDFVAKALADLEVEILFSKVNIKPGRPLVFGRRRKTLVFGLPGNPVSTGVTFLQFVRPAILAMQGRTDVVPVRHPAILQNAIMKTDGKRHYLRGVATPLEGKLHVRTTGTQSSGVLSSLVRANCLIIVPEQVRQVNEGETVEIEFVHQDP